MPAKTLAEDAAITTGLFLDLFHIECRQSVAARFEFDQTLKKAALRGQKQ
jgi:hypothetical protein